MAPTRNPLKAIRRQVAQESRLRASALAGSGFHDIQTRNALLDTCPVVSSAPKPSPKRVTKKMPAPKARLPPPTTETRPVESWSPAGGERVSADGKGVAPTISSLLGIAQIATWRKDQFVSNLKSSMSGHTDYEEVVAQTIDYGGEMRTDVFVKFRSELVAEAAMEKLNGLLLDGRKLQVRYT